MISAGAVEITSIRPTGARVLVRVPEQVDRTTSGGIYLPDGSDATRAHVVAEVVAVGPGEVTPKGRVREPGVSPGNLVILEYHAWGMVHSIDGEPHTIVDPHVILGVVDA